VKAHFGAVVQLFLGPWAKPEAADVHFEAVADSHSESIAPNPGAVEANLEAIVDAECFEATLELWKLA
jgi:hypothetical protein